MVTVRLTAALDDGLEVSWLPSYGPEMRGGTANCSVIISPEPIPSPVIAHDATSLIVMNLPSFRVGSCWSTAHSSRRR